MPLCTTLASESIYESFLGDEKRDALLHGHSYTAHPVGCVVANKSLEMLSGLERDGSWGVYEDDWRGGAMKEDENAGVWSMWGKEFVRRVSNCEAVESVVALGSVLAISLQDANAGKL